MAGWLIITFCFSGVTARLLRKRLLLGWYSIWCQTRWRWQHFTLKCRVEGRGARSGSWSATYWVAERLIEQCGSNRFGDHFLFPWEFHDKNTIQLIRFLYYILSILLQLSNFYHILYVNIALKHQLWDLLSHISISLFLSFLFFPFSTT